jgi:hypothetical protein
MESFDTAVSAVLCVADEAPQQQLTLGLDGQDGALAGIHAGSIIFDLSVVSPNVSRRLHEAITLGEWTGWERSAP